jgi:hypothetical protein
MGKVRKGAAGRRRVPYSQHSRKDRVREKATKELLELVGGKEEEVDILLSDLTGQGGVKSTLDLLATNIKATLALLPKRSLLRHALVDGITQGLPKKEAAELTGVSVAAIKRAHKSNAIKLLPEAQIKVSVKRLSRYLLMVVFQGLRTVQRVPDEEMAWLSTWLLENAPIRSGTENDRRTSYNTWEKLYLAYIHALGGMLF